MTLQDRLVAQQRLAQQLYLRRQQIQAQIHELQQQAVLCDQALVKTDGAIEVLDAVIAEQAKAGSDGV